MADEDLAWRDAIKERAGWEESFAGSLSVWWREGVAFQLSPYLPRWVNDGPRVAFDLKTSQAPSLLTASWASPSRLRQRPQLLHELLRRKATARSSLEAMVLWWPFWLFFGTRPEMLGATMLRPGLYDDLLTERLRLELEKLGDGKLVPLFGKLESGLLRDYLTRFLARS